MRIFVLLFLLAACPAAAQPAARLLVGPPADTLRVRVFRPDGALRYEAALPHHPDDPPPQVALAGDAGAAVYVRPATAEVFFLAPDGSLHRRVALFDAAPHALERVALVATSPDGRLVAVAAQREAARPGLAGADATVLFVFDAEGTLRWRRSLPGPALQALAVSAHPLVAVSTYDAYAGPGVQAQSRVFDADGAPVFEAPVGADAFHFGDGEVLLVQKRSAAAYDLGGGHRFTYRPEAGAQIVDAAAGAPHALLVGRAAYAPQGFVFEDLRLVAVGSEGAVVSARPVGSGQAPALSLEPDGAVVVVDGAPHRFAWPR